MVTLVQFRFLWKLPKYNHNKVELGKTEYSSRKASGRGKPLYEWGLWNCGYLHWQWRWVFHRLGETHTHNGDPAWSCCCGTSICSCLSGFLLETLPLCGAPPPRAPSHLHAHCTGSGKFTHTQTVLLSLSYIHMYSIALGYLHSLEKGRETEGLNKWGDFQF